MAGRVPLDNVEHQRLRLIDRIPAEACANQALVVPLEFEQLQREFPILFRKDSDGHFQSVAILGLDRGENLFIEQDRWITRYVPATLRRGPFFLATGAESDAETAIIVDLDDERVTEGEGEPLFLTHGGAAPALQRTADALRTVHEGLALSGGMFTLFLELGLLVPLELDIELGDGRSYGLPGFFTVGAEQLASLDGGELERLNSAGLLAATFQARSSLGNLQRLADLKLRKLAQAGDD